MSKEQEVAVIHQEGERELVVVGAVASFHGAGRRRKEQNRAAPEDNAARLSEQSHSFH